jgi:hypothetical protein
VTSRDITVTARDEGVHGLVVTNSSSIVSVARVFRDEC